MTQWLAIGIYFIVMLAIGLFAFRTSTSNTSGYLLGGRQVSPQVTALSAGASDMSGWMLMGLPGAMFIAGFDTLLIAVGLLVGAWANYQLVAPKLRVYTEVAGDALTLPEFFSNRFGDSAMAIRITSAIIIVLFFTLYTSAGLVAGGKLFESAFNVDYTIGLWVTLIVVISYTLLGGFLAVSLTDFVQGCIMFIALVLVPYVALSQFDSVNQMYTAATASIPDIDNAVSGLTILGIISSLAWGLGYFGQPHIVVRFMAIRSIRDISVARRIGISWMFITIVGALSTGFVGVAYVNAFGLAIDDPETIFIVFSQILFHPFISGFLLAAILAAVMSTISSQLLVSASSLAEDLFSVMRPTSNNDKTRGVLIGRCGVVCVGVIAALIALDQSNSVLGIVSSAWAGFGAAFGPLVLCCLYKKNLTHKAAITGIVTGAFTVLLWRYAPILEQGKTLSSIMYEIVPGFIVSYVSIFIVSALDSKPKSEVRADFDKTQHLVNKFS